MAEVTDSVLASNLSLQYGMDGTLTMVSVGSTEWKGPEIMVFIDSIDTIQKSLY
jgi:hypothetical protein